MLPPTVASALTAARQSDARRRAEQARYLECARTQPVRPAPVEPPARRRIRWRRVILRPS